MPDLRDLKFIREERRESARPQIEHAIIANTPTGFNDPVFVILPEFANDQTWGPYRWVHNGSDMPQEGDDCLVAFSNRREGWVIAYWSEVYTSADAADVISVFGRDGAVVANAGDYDVSQVTGAESTSHASSTYETQSHAVATYETQAHAALTYAPLSRTPKITTSALSGGPPGSPSDGDIWIATAVDANGTRWQFQYNAGSSSTYKWEFIGGPPVVVGPAGSMTLAATGQTPLTGGPTFATVRAGDYIFGMGIIVNANAAQFLETQLNGSVAGLSAPILVWSPPAGFYYDDWVETKVLAAVAQTWNLACSIANATVSTGFQSGILKVLPVRIS